MEQKKVKLQKGDYEIVEGKIVLKNPELSNLIAGADYDADAESGDNAVTITVSVSF